MNTSNLKQKINSVNYRILSNIDKVKFPINYSRDISIEDENYLIARLVKSGMNWKEIIEEFQKAETGQLSEFSDLMINPVQGDDYTFKDSAVPFVVGMLVIIGILNVAV